jgi:alkylhydroperoxidase/carboxymuconolactone decarboxylase family protein YurZ
MEKKAARIISKLDNFQKESPQYFELIRLFKKELKHISNIDSKVTDLINIALAMAKQPPALIDKNIETAFHDGIRQDDIIAAACLALINLENADRSIIIPLIESISRYNPVTKFRSDNYWYEN